MPTPMRVFAQIAAEHGIDPGDDEAVDQFFVRDVPRMPRGEQEQIFTRLLDADGTEN